MHVYIVLRIHEEGKIHLAMIKSLPLLTPMWKY